MIARSVNTTLLALLGAAAVTPASGFGILKAQTTTSSALLAHWPPSSPALKNSERTSWSEYEHDFVEPLTAHAPDSGSAPLDASASKRNVADAYWLQRFEDDRDKLHHMLTHIDYMTSNTNTAKTSKIGKPDTWAHYRHEYIDAKIPRKTRKQVVYPMTDEKRAIADEYWMKNYQEGKDKLAKMSPMDLLP